MTCDAPHVAFHASVRAHANTSMWARYVSKPAIATCHSIWRYDWEHEPPFLRQHVTAISHQSISMHYHQQKQISIPNWIDEVGLGFRGFSGLFRLAIPLHRYQAAWIHTTTQLDDSSALSLKGQKDCIVTFVVDRENSSLCRDSISNL